jgi:hypothetical protein
LTLVLPLTGAAAALFPALLTTLLTALLPALAGLSSSDLLPPLLLARSAAAATPTAATPPATAGLMLLADVIRDCRTYSSRQQLMTDMHLPTILSYPVSDHACTVLCITSPLQQRLALTGPKVQLLQWLHLQKKNPCHGHEAP